jgi:hypothetical protein
MIENLERFLVFVIPTGIGGRRYVNIPNIAGMGCVAICCLITVALELIRPVQSGNSGARQRRLSVA